MKEIKQIRIEDCVECYASNFVKELHNECPKVYIAFKTTDNGYVDNCGEYWTYAIPCEILDNPPKPKWSDKYPAEWSIHAKVFKALSEGAVVRYKDDNRLVFNDWNTEREHKNFQICTNYTGTESDVWEEIE